MGRESVVAGAALAATVVLWASAFAGIRAGLEGYGPGHLVLLRFLVASAVFGVWAGATGLRPPARRDVPGVVAVGLCGYAGYQLALSRGEQTVSAGVASLLVNTAPVFTALLAVALLGERMRWVGWLGLGVSFGGAALIAVAGEGGFRLSGGAGTVLVAAVLHSFHFALQKPYLATYRPVAFTAYSVWAGTAALLVFLPGLVDAVRAAPAGATAAVVYLGVFPAAVAKVTWAMVLHQMPASRAASFLYLVPAVAFLIGWVWLGEVPTAVKVVGGVVALAGVILVNRWGRVAALAGANQSAVPTRCRSA